MVAMIIVVVLIVSTIGVFLYATTSGSAATVKSGDKIKVNYIGMLPDGKVFDTSLYTVALDNTTYPKSLFFTFRGNESTYKPLEFTVGGGAMITGFDHNMTGMKVGETKTFNVTAKDGYGSWNTSKLITINLNEVVPVQKTMTAAEFQTYYGKAPVNMQTFKDPKYGWDVYVFYDGTNAIVQNLVPSGGADFKVYGSSTDSSYGWYVNATYDQQGNILVHHLLNSSSPYNVKGIDGTDSKKLFVESVDEAAGTAVLNKNSEYIGRTLTFTVTLVSIG